MVFRLIKNYHPLAVWLKTPFWAKVMVALALGIVVGLALGPKAEALRFIGTIFIHGIQMLIVPVVFTAIVCAVISIEELAKMRRVVLKALPLYAISMLVAAAIGVFLALWLKPGVGFHLHIAGNTVIHLHEAPNAGDILVGFVPSNVIEAFYHNNVVQILIFAVLLGLAIKMAGKPAEPVANLFKAFSSVVFKFAELIIAFAPYGIFALIAYVFGKYGATALLPLFEFVATVYLACIVQCVLFYAVVLFFNGINPLHFAKGILSAVVLAFTTASSAATLPVTMRCAEKNLHIERGLSGFLLPLGTTFNLNGISIYLAVATIFAADLYGIHLGFAQIVTVLVTITFTSVGAAAIPGSGLVVMSAVMTAAGVPLGAMPLIAGVDRFNDMVQTATSVVGDLFATKLVAKSEANRESTT